MGELAEYTAATHNVSRGDQDAFAAEYAFVPLSWSGSRSSPCDSLPSRRSVARMVCGCYAFAGDEAFPYPRDDRPGAPPQRAAGWIHVIEWDEWSEPKEVARYQVPEAGSHNLWIEDEVLYIGYYGGGLRVVDISGELRGDLYRQGREIAFWHPNDPESFKPNAPNVWGAQPYKGHIFLADFSLKAQ